jgi:hypothetical protein
MGGARQTTGDSRTRYARVEWFLRRESAIRTANAGQAAQHFDRVPTYVPLPDLRQIHTADLLIQPARDHEHHDLPFAAGQQGVAGPERLYLRLVTKCSVAALDRILHRGKALLRIPQPRPS